MEVTVKKLRSPAIVYILRIVVCGSLIVGVASVAFRGELYSLRVLSI